jgi:hypothetical protein
MNEEFQIHLVGKIFWLPHHKPEKSPFPTETIFRALAKFTSDFMPSYTVLVSYSSTVNGQEFHDVRLNIPFGDIDDIQKLAKNTEILIMDGYKVIAICRNLIFTANSGKNMGDSWISR